MKITLAFQIFNKEKTIKSVLESWINTSSNKHEYEYIIVFDACKDKSQEIAKRVMIKHKLNYKFLYADDKYEIYCNNLALKHSTGDIIIFIQDDNWIYTNYWDQKIVQLYSNYKNIGAISLLAGVELIPCAYSYWKKLFHLINFKSALPLFDYNRIEKQTRHKSKVFSKYKVKNKPWVVDAVIRPFAIKRKLISCMGGLDNAYSPSCGDDMDLSIKLLQQGKKNIYLPLDLVNLTTSHETMVSEFIEKLYKKAYRILSTRYHKYISTKLQELPNRNVSL